MVEIRRGFRPRGDRVSVGHRTGAGTAQLRKDEPHPVPGLASPTQFGAKLSNNRVLRLDKALQIIGFAGCGLWRHRVFLEIGAAAYARRDQRPPAMTETDLYPAV
jgi:hypothetical protein